ncbi:MAG: T9SS type A sorting domain-containing protein [Bacteroidetes bacterium]|jgi:hypothetical protein|nr:T9SS type A sorting domain-containing protein [Bacteroidota bacterium]MBT6687942.1 T9SS type A sorting domain-containing protein [Bacteroidota bacterium]MBT7143281.1 T9SS type A sorting domain-containing protein [Bacteroidota bacterium]MBT7490262.1 T9SS type A sorting domain-containing protein [Bacteroidota bacterium]
MKTKVFFSLLLVVGLLISQNSNSQNLTYPSNSQTNVLEKSDYQSTKHFVNIKNTGNNMTVGIPNFVWLEKPQVGDEIGAFNSTGKLVGSVCYVGKNTAIAIWGDDETTEEKEGVANGELFTLQLWHHKTGQIDILEVESYLEGNGNFKTNGISIINKLKVKQNGEVLENSMLYQNTPNPTKDFTEIKFYVSDDSNVKISLFTTKGKFIEDLTNQDYSAGEYTLKFNTSQLASGNYYYKMVSENFTQTKYLNISR